MFVAFLASYFDKRNNYQRTITAHDARKTNKTESANFWFLARPASGYLPSFILADII